MRDDVPGGFDSISPDKERVKQHVVAKTTIAIENRRLHPATFAAVRCELSIMFIVISVSLQRRFVVG